KTDPKARYQGYSFFFKEGLCWSDINTTYLKCRKKQKGINDVKSMSLFGISNKVPEYMIISLINSTFMSKYVDDFVNNTQTFQINDARQIPIVIPTTNQLVQFTDIFNHALLIKQTTNSELDLQQIQIELEELVLGLYGIK
ncbi:MAG: DNA modification methylase, partial [Paludibacteraceae bacterium]